MSTRPLSKKVLISRVLAAGLPYIGADFRFDPPALEPFPLPSIGIVGTGKRVGKTAITAHAARLYARDRRVVVVAMGRGGPPEPEVASVAPDVDSLLELSRSGRHAASDYLETAALAGVEPSSASHDFAREFIGGERTAILLGNLAQHHPHAAILHQLAQAFGEVAGARVGVLGEAANSVGGYIAGATPFGSSWTSRQRSARRWGLAR